jgi:hypothetical protein
MAQRSLEERMAEMQQRIEALQRAKQQLGARQTVAERKRQERRRYLLGSFVLEQLGNDEQLADYLRRALPGFLKEERDRKLFAVLFGSSNGEDAVAASMTGETGQHDDAAAVSPARETGESKAA